MKLSSRKVGMRQSLLILCVLRMSITPEIVLWTATVTQTVQEEDNVSSVGTTRAQWTQTAAPALVITIPSSYSKSADVECADITVLTPLRSSLRPVLITHLTGVLQWN